MIRNKSFINFICAISIATVLLVTVTGKTIPVFALAVGSLADPVYDTEILAFKDYVESNLDAPQLDIMFFLIGGLAVGQMGAQDAMLITPYPNEENVKEWIINCGIQLYNSVIGLVPEGDYYMGIPSIGTGGQKGIPRQVIKALVAQMMGDAVVAINYPDLNTFLVENPDKILLPFNADLQIGVNAIFGLDGGLDEWQYTRNPFTSNQSWASITLNDVVSATYLNDLSLMTFPHVRYNQYQTWYNAYVSSEIFNTHNNLFIDYINSRIYFSDDYGNFADNTLRDGKRIYVTTSDNDQYVTFNNPYPYIYLGYVTYNGGLYDTFIELAQAFFNHAFANQQESYLYEDFIKHVYVGTTWLDKTEIFNDSDLNISNTLLPYYQKVTNDYLFDLRGLMGDLVNYVYTNQIWDNIYDLVGNLVLPDRVNVSVDLTPITDLLAPPLQVNLNDIDFYTDNDYLTEIKQRSQKFGETLGEYFVFWHNSDPMTVYVIFGSVIVILIGAFIGKWGHS